LCFSLTLLWLCQKASIFIFRIIPQFRPQLSVDTK
jgi:hypothetical protein